MSLLLDIWRARTLLGVTVGLFSLLAVFFSPSIGFVFWGFGNKPVAESLSIAIKPIGFLWIVFLIESTIPVWWLLGVEQYIYHAVRRVVPGDNFITENFVKSMMQHAQWEHWIFGESALEPAVDSHLKRRRSI